MLMFCAKISAGVVISLLGAISPGAADTGVILMDAGQSGFGTNVPVWALAMVMAAAAYSVWREAAITVPPALKAWVGEKVSLLVAASALMVLGAYALA
jgi:hypothetical protein